MSGVKLLSTKSSAARGRRTLASVSVLLAASALALTGCSSDQDSAGKSSGEPGAKSSSTSTGSPSPSSADGSDVTEPGTKLAFGDTATVPYTIAKQGTVLDLTVKSAAQGSLEDFKGFDMSDPYKRKASYFYVRVAVQNAGKDKLGGVPVPLWGISDKGILLQAVDFKSAFAKCPTEQIPKDFAPKDKLETCLVYLSPNHGGLTGVSYRPTVDYQPIEWHGKVQAPEKPKTKGGNKGGGKAGGKGGGKGGGKQ